jgi:hypothetical protein
VLAAKRMIQRSLERFDLYPSRLLGDSAYGSAAMLGWLVYEHGIEPHVTVFDKSARTDGTFSREDFTYDHVGDVYRCPGGKTLTTTGTPVNDEATILYRASWIACPQPYWRTSSLVTCCRTLLNQTYGRTRQLTLQLGWALKRNDTEAFP